MFGSNGGAFPEERACGTLRPMSGNWMNGGSDFLEQPHSGSRFGPYGRRFGPHPSRRALITFGALAAASSALSLTRLASAAEWEQIDDSDGILVFKKDVANSPVHAFRGLCTIDAPMEKVMWVLADNEHRTEWVDRLKQSVILERRSPYDFILYQHFGAPPMISDRDFVYHAQAHSEADGSAVLDIKSIHHPKAPKSPGVRGFLEYSSYVLRAQGAEKTQVEVTVLMDPKGALPKWVVNLVQKSWPKNTLSALRTQVKKPFVKTLAAPPQK